MADRSSSEQAAFSIGGARLERRDFLKAIAAIAAASPLAACSGARPAPAAVASSTVPATSAGNGVKLPGPPWQGGVRGGTATSLWSDKTLNFDPPLAYGQGDYYGLSNFYRGLAFYNSQNEPELDLAKSLDVSPDGKTYTFVLKPGVKFHNGRTVTAADFKWTFERSSSKKIGSWVQGFLGSVQGHADFVADKAKTISGIVARDDATLVLELTRPDVTILGVVAIPPFYVLPKEEVAKLGAKLSTTPIGTGPYRLKSWDDDARTVTGERNPDYLYAAELPYLDEVAYQWGVSDDVAYLKVSRNEADLALELPASAIPRIRRDPGQSGRFKEWPSFTLAFWQFDVTKPPFDDPKVRQAVNHAFNRERTKVLGYDPNGHFFPPGLLGYDQAAPVYAYDPDKAKALLAEAGASSLSLTLPALDAGSANSARLAELLQQDLQAVGITVQLEQVQQTAFDIGNDLSKKYRMWNVGWGMGLPDPSELVNSLIGTKAPSNYGGYSSTAIDTAGRAAVGESDRTKRGALYAQIEKTLLEDAPILFLGVSVRTSFTSESLQNFSWEPALWTFWDRYWKKP